MRGATRDPPQHCALFTSNLPFSTVHIMITFVDGPTTAPQKQFVQAGFPSNMPAIWDTLWARIARDHVAPIVIGEFGGLCTGLDSVLQSALVAFMNERRIGGFWWSVNPESADTGGLVTDWESLDPERGKLALLRSLPATPVPQRRPQPGTRPSAMLIKPPSPAAPPPIPSVPPPFPESPCPLPPPPPMAIELEVVRVGSGNIVWKWPPPSPSPPPGVWNDAPRAPSSVNEHPPPPFGLLWTFLAVGLAWLLYLVGSTIVRQLRMLDRLAAERLAPVDRDRVAAQRVSPIEAKSRRREGTKRKARPMRGGTWQPVPASISSDFSHSDEHVSSMNDTVGVEMSSSYHTNGNGTCSPSRAQATSGILLMPPDASVGDDAACGNECGIAAAMKAAEQATASAVARLQPTGSPGPSAATLPREAHVPMSDTQQRRRAVPIIMEMDQ